MISTCTRYRTPRILLQALATSFALGFAAGIAQASDEKTQEVVIKTDKIQFIYDVTAFTVKAGKPVVVKFMNISPIPHNFILLKQGKKEVVGALADAMMTDPLGMQKGYLPESDDIIVHSKLLQGMQNEDIKFTAPSEPGDYPYICTFPGHWRLMNGVMTVEK